MNTIETFEMSVNTDFITIAAQHQNNKGTFNIASNDVIINADCTNACSMAQAVLLVNGEKIGQFNFELQKSGFEAKIQAEDLVGNLIFKQNGVSKLAGRFEDDNLVQGKYEFLENDKFFINNFKYSDFVSIIE